LRPIDLVYAFATAQVVAVFSTRVIMSGSSIALFLAGVACLFAPVEVLSAIGISSPDELTGQVLGALYLAFAAANWTARGSMIGGIYARPLSVANFVHFFVGATVLVKGVSSSTSNAGYLVILLVYVAFAIAFILMLYGRFHRSGKPVDRPEGADK
jgi:hypothetical protein